MSLVTDWVVAYCILSMILNNGEAQMSLSYPPARKYPLDFLDNYSTPGPCGIPKGFGPITTLIAGSSINVTWFMPYLQRGRFQLTLLNNQEETIYNFTENFTEQNDVITYLEVSLPDKECLNCSLRLLRESEYRSLDCGRRYFWTCADIHIVKSIQEKDICNGFLKENGQCFCQKPCRGCNCQYKDNCDTDMDCSGHGICVKSGDPFVYLSKRCFCDRGYYGPNCERESSIKTIKLDVSQYTHTDLSPRFQLLHRILHKEEEIEVILKVKTNTWVGIGWRPANFKSGCKYFLVLPGSTRKIANSNSTNSAEPMTSSNSDCRRGIYNGNNDTTGDDLSAMDCTDLVIGAARGMRSWIGDFYTRDFATPLRDHLYYGSDSLTAAVGFEKDGYTYILFRRKLRANERTDHDIDDNTMHLIWAKGQDTIYHPLKWRTRNETFIKETHFYFFKEDELKYHGTQDQRAYRNFNFFDGQRNIPPSERCHNKWGNCSRSNDTDCFLVTWTYDTSRITFTIKAYLEINQWVSIGFNSINSMVGADTVVGWRAENGDTIVQDRKTHSQSEISVDSQQDITLISSSTEDSVTTLTFSRPLATNDPRDFSLSYNCAYFIFTRGVFIINASITYSNNTTFTTNEKICIPCTEVLKNKEKERTLSISLIIIIVTFAVCTLLFLVLGIQVCVKVVKKRCV